MPENPRGFSRSERTSPASRASCAGPAGGQDLVERTVMPTAIPRPGSAIQAGILIDVTPARPATRYLVPCHDHSRTAVLRKWRIVIEPIAPSKKIRPVVARHSHGLSSAPGQSDDSVAPARLSGSADLAAESVPQPVPVVCHHSAADPRTRRNVTIVLPNEVSLSITSLN